MLLKLMIKAVITLTITMGIIGYITYLTTGKTPFSYFTSADTINPTLPDISLSKISNKIESLGKDVNAQLKRSQEDIGEVQRVYKWKDVNGVTQYTSEAPPSSINAEILELDPATNIIQSSSGLMKNEDQAATNKEHKPQSPTAPAIPEHAQSLIEEAKNVQHLLDERSEQQKAIIDSM